MSRMSNQVTRCPTITMNTFSLRCRIMSLILWASHKNMGSLKTTRRITKKVSCPVSRIRMKLRRSLRLLRAQLLKK